MDNQDIEMMKDAGLNGKSTTRSTRKINKKLLFPILILLLIVTAGIFLKSKLFDRQENKEEILTLSTLEKIINISELSTFQAVYNGIAKGVDIENPDKLDYYVSYQAKVYAGFDFEKVKITMDEDTKKITVIIPKIEITDINVDIASLDYIFLNKKANTNTVSEKAYKVCIEDAKNESEKEAAIYDLAEQNAKNMMKALIGPFVEQLDSNYELEIN